MILCPKCGVENSLMHEKCIRCAEFLGYPNVNDCSSKEEQDALEKRYKEKVKWADSNGHGIKRAEFEEELKKSVAVINVDLKHLYRFVVLKRFLYSSYQLQTRGEARTYARSQFDKERLGVEGTLFGSYGREIRYAALSMDGSGLTSYGGYTIILAEDAIEARSTLLEENSYFFIKKHKILAGGKFPPGFRALWKDRHKLATAKLIEKIVLTKRKNYSIIVLENTNDRKKDEFIEIHIYGAINRDALQAVRGNSRDNPGNEEISSIKDYLNHYDKEWIEK